MINRNPLHKFSLIVSLFSIITVLDSCESPQGNKSENVLEANIHKEHPEEVELAEIMFHNQRYIEKLYFAGKNQNWELAEFYHHEMEENMEKVIDGKIMEDEINVSKLAVEMYNPVSIELKNAIHSKDTTSFVKGYNLMVRTCNNCHAASKHAFIKITTPSKLSITNQEFK